MNPPLVSIIIPLYNAERLIGETLQSALAQTWKNTEIIVVDDESTDGSANLVKRFESAQVKIIRQKNAGPGVARNTGLGLAQGDYIQYLDHDDLLSPGKISEQVHLLQANDKGTLAICGAIYFPHGSDPSRLPVERGWPTIDTDDTLDWAINLLGEHGVNGAVATHAWLTPRDLIDAAGPWELIPSPDDDGEYFCRVALASKRIRTAKEGFVMHRKFPNSANMGSAKSEQLQWAALGSLQLKQKHILSRTDDPRAKRGLARCYMHRAFLAYPHYPKVTEAALRCAEEMGGTKWNPFPTSRGRIVSNLIGWKLTRRASLALHSRNQSSPGTVKNNERGG